MKRMTPRTIKKSSRRLHETHGYLAGNYAPVTEETPLTPCTFVGSLPKELAGGQYVRNGGNPRANEDAGRESHWFDGDGEQSRDELGEDAASILTS